MTSSEIRIAVAKAYGWKLVAHQYTNGGDAGSSWVNPTGFGMPLPNFPESLDACSCFEKTLQEHERGQYLDAIYDQLKDQEIAFFATPLQRCIAFLKVKGLWQE